MQGFFKDKLCSLFPEAELLENPSMLDQFPAKQMLVAVGPAKAPPRMQEKVRNAASEGLEWPNAGQLGDPLRAMVVCGRGRYAQPWLAWERICAAFGVKALLRRRP